MNAVVQTDVVRRKTVVIDLQSLLHMKHAMGIDAINWHGFMEVLRNETGSCKRVYQTFCTIHPDQYKCGRLASGLRHDLEALQGITLLPVESAGERDDAVVKKMLHTSASQSSDVVLVSTDGDIIRDLIWLGQHKKISVHLAATLRDDPKNNHCSICKSIVSNFIESGLLSFCELASFVHRIGKKTPAYGH